MTSTAPAVDWKTRYFFVTTSLVLLFTILYVGTMFFSRKISYYSFKLTMMFANLAFAYRVYYSTPYPTFSLQGVKAWATTFINTNNFQYTLFCFMFAQGQPVMMSLFPVLIHSGYQWLTIMNKLYASHPMWTSRGAALFEKAQANMMGALVMCASTEIGLWLFLIIELMTPARNPLRIVLYLNFLRLRYRCTDNTVMRIKFAGDYGTAFYHHQVWSQLGEKLSPLTNLKYVQPVYQAVQKWFTGM